MTQIHTRQDEEWGAAKPLGCWLRVAMGVAGACALAAQAALELSALAMPAASYALQPQQQQPQPPPAGAVPQAGAPPIAARPCTAPCAEVSTNTIRG